MSTPAGSLILTALLIVLSAGCGGGSGGQTDACPAATGGPTTHQGYLTSEETWSAAGSPHLVTGPVQVQANLRIEACAVVLLAPGVGITVTAGQLETQGQPERPVRFDQRDAGMRWGTLGIEWPGTARLAYTDLQGGGEDGGDGVTVLVRGTGALPPVAPLWVDHLTIRDSRGTGVLLKSQAAFAEGSADLTVTQAGADDPSHPYPLRLSTNAMGTVPGGVYTGNAVDEIQVIGESPAFRLNGQVQLMDRGVPYHVGGNGFEPVLRLGGDPGADPSALTLEAGVELRFEEGGELLVQGTNTTNLGVGVLQAQGSADRPVRFGSAAAGGRWIGIYFTDVPAPASVIDRAVISDAGGPCGCSLASCQAVGQGFATPGAIIFGAQPLTAFVTNTAIVRSAGHGITRGYFGDPVDFLPTNTFEQVDGCWQSFPKDKDGSCPADPPCPK